MIDGKTVKCKHTCKHKHNICCYFCGHNLARQLEFKVAFVTNVILMHSGCPGSSEYNREKGKRKEKFNNAAYCRMMERFGKKMPCVLGAKHSTGVGAVEAKVL